MARKTKRVVNVTPKMKAEAKKASIGKANKQRVSHTSKADHHMKQNAAQAKARKRRRDELKPQPAGASLVLQNETAVRRDKKWKDPKPRKPVTTTLEKKFRPHTDTRAPIYGNERFRVISMPASKWQVQERDPSVREKMLAEGKIVDTREVPLWFALYRPTDKETAQRQLERTVLIAKPQAHTVSSS